MLIIYSKLIRNVAAFGGFSYHLIMILESGLLFWATLYVTWLHVDISLIFWLFKPEYLARLVLMNWELSCTLTIIFVSNLTIWSYQYFFNTFGNATLAGISNQLCRHPDQAVLNASARSVAGLRRSDHITATLANFHWLRASERIQFKLATLVYQSLNGLAPRYLSDDLRRVADIPSWRNLRSASSCQLEVPRTRLTSVGDRTFSAAGSSSMEQSLARYHWMPKCWSF